MLKADAVRLNHMLDAAKEARSFVKDATRASLDVDRKLTLALIRCVEVVGEAASQVTEQCCEDLPQIPWASIIGMRNRLIHAYFDINLDILWKTATEDLPTLIEELERVLSPGRP